MPARLITRSFVLGWLANFFHSLAFHSYLHLPGYLHGLDAAELTIGVVMATMSAAAILSRPIIGAIIDGYGRRVIVWLGGATNVAVSLCYLAVYTIGPGLYAIRIIHGFAEAMLFTVLFTIAADLVPASRRAEGIALFGVSGMIPLALSGLIGDAIIASSGYKPLFAFTGACAVAGTVAGMWLPDLRPTRGPHDAPIRSFAQAVLDRQLRPIWLAGFSFSLAIASYFTFLKTFVIEREVGSVGSFFLAYTLAAVLLRVFFGWVPDRYGLRRTLVPSIICLAAGASTLAFAHSDLHVLAAGLLCGIGHGYAFPVASAMVVARSRPFERGATLGAFTALFDLGLFVGAPALGLLLQYSDYTTMFVTAGVAASLGALGFFAWDRRLHLGG